MTGICLIPMPTSSDVPSPKMLIKYAHMLICIYIYVVSAIALQ